ncbi:MAG: amidohydrolase family protein [Defluviicoccus sp.]|nr:amidohydrolase family protein [Defluviicoccus sp.]MDE0382710.1 amidohydrolase family protein [Defluviicoccus sp.]
MSSQTRALDEITVRTDTRDILAHASRERKRHRFDEMLIIDVDAHVTETAFWGEVVDRIDSDVYQHMAASFRDRTGSPPGLLNAVPGMAYQDVYGRIPHQQSLAEPVQDSDVHRQVALTRRAMDSMGIDYMVVFPTPMLSLGTHPQPDVEVELAWAFNRWLTEEVLPQEPRMKGLLYLPFNTPEACPRFVEEFGDKPGTMGFTVTSTRFRPVHHNAYMPLYAALEERNLPLAFHAGFNWNDGSMAQLNRFLSMHALSFVHCNLIHMTNWVINGLPVRFPGLKVLWIESGIAWLPYLMQRLDSEYMMRSSEAPLLTRRPSEYITDMYFSSQPLESQHPKLMEATFEAIDAETQLLWCSDWPHWDFDSPSVIWDLPFLNERQKRRIMGENAAELFGLDNPYLAREAAE